MSDLAKAPPPPLENACTMVCPAERHIPVAFPEIFNIVKTTMTVGQRQRYEEVCQLVESLYAQEVMTLRRNIKSNFLAFSVGAKNQELVTRVGRSLPPKADLDMREERLVSDFLQLMAAARYQILTKKEWETATSEQFVFHLPVEVNWNFFDDKMLSTFWASNTERRKLRKQLPDLADRVLIFHRGIGVAEDHGRYINQKIDLLVEYLVMNPLLRFWAWLCALWVALLAKMPWHKQAPDAPTILQMDGPFVTRVAAEPEGDGAGRLGRQSSQRTKEDLSDMAANGVRVVERRTIKRLLPSAWSVIQNFHRVLDLQEPMYKDVVTLYRTKGEGRNERRNKQPVRCRSNQERLKGILSRRNVHVKCFHDIPMADMEVIFPDKQVHLKTLSLINMVVQGCTAFVGAMAGLHQAGHLTLQSVWTALSLVGARCSQLYSVMQAERSRMVQEMVNILYDKTNDSQEGVLSMLLEDVAEQQLKEAVLAYTMAYLNLEDELTQSSLDELCEKFLEDNFDLKLDFATEDAVPKLIKWGMLKRNPKNGRYQAEPVELAYKSLTDLWSKAYEELSKPPTHKVRPLMELLAESDRRIMEETQDPDRHPANSALSVGSMMKVIPGLGGDRGGVRNEPRHVLPRVQDALAEKQPNAVVREQDMVMHRTPSASSSHHHHNPLKPITSMFKRKKSPPEPVGKEASLVA